MIKPSEAASQLGRDPQGFFGREAEIKWVNERLARGEPLLMIRGSHGVGKTALLRQLVRRLSDRYLAVYLDADPADGHTSASPLVKVAGEIVRHLRKRGVQVDLPEVTSATQDALPAWRSYFATLTARLDSQPLVLLIDNAEHASSDWLPVLLQVASSVIVASESQKVLDGLRADAARPPSITLGSLDSEAASDLIRALVVPRSQIEPWTVRRIFEMTSGHPYYARLFCRVLLEDHAFKSPLLPLDAEETLHTLLDMPMAEFEGIWESSLPRERALLAVFGALRGQGGVATQYDIQKSGIRLGFSIPLKEIVATLDALARRGVLEKLGSNSYRFPLELLRLWIRERYEPEQVLRKERWRSGVSAVPLVGPLVRLLSRRPALWVSLAVIAVVSLVVIGQPGVLREMRDPTATSGQIGTTVERPETPTVVPTPATVVPSYTPTPVPLLPGYDLVFMARTDANAPWQIYAMNLSTGSQFRLTETNSNERTPKWSPDGNRLVFASDRDGNRDVYVMYLVAGSALINLTQHKAPDWQPSWSPDGARVAFSSYRDGNWEVYLINADGMNLVRMTDHPESDFSPTWSPNGAKLLFVSRRQGDADLFALDFATGELTQLTYNEQDEYDPAWSPDGEWIAFVTQIGDQGDIFVMRADGSDPANLTHSQYANDFQPAWTPDSQGLIFVSSSAADSDHDLFLMQRDGSQTRRLTDDDRDNLAPSQCPVNR